MAKSYDDYPKAATEEAKRALKHRDEYGRATSCGTAVGWQRANQLANREPLSAETVKRTYSFLSRSKTYDQGKFLDSDGNEICGSVMYAAWGGDPMLRWCEKVAASLEEEEQQSSFRHIEEVMEDEDTITIVFRKPGAGESPSRAEPSEVSVGDYVSWGNSGGRAYGRVERTEEDGQVEADSGFVVNGTPDDPAALISVYDYSEEAGAYQEKDPPLRVAHRFSALRKEDSSKFAAAKSASRAQKASSARSLHFRGSAAVAEGQNKISGYGIVFGSDSLPLHVYDEERGVVEVVERISRQSLEGADMSDMVCAFNHNFDYVLGRTSNGTMQVEIDDRGARYTVTPSDTSYARDLMANLEAGNVTGSSFYFSIDDSAGYDIEEREDGKLQATPRKITEVYEMGPVTSPAYPDTTSERRSALHEQAKDFLSRSREAGGQDNDDDVRQAIAAHKRRKFIKQLRQG
jgi:hypothetical protein